MSAWEALTPRHRRQVRQVVRTGTMPYDAAFVRAMHTWVAEVTSAPRSVPPAELRRAEIVRELLNLPA